METIGIVGASLAGVNTAVALRRKGFDGKVILIGEEPGLPYDRPPLSKEFLTGAKREDSIGLHPAELYESLDIDVLTETRVEGLDPRAGRLALSSGWELDVDAVVLATGGTSRRLPVPGHDLAGVHYLRTMAEAAALRDALPNASKIAVVGGGFIGAEVAATARTLGKDVTVIERERRILARVLPDQLSDLLAGMHRQSGVEIRTGQDVVSLVGHDAVHGVQLADGSVVEADLVVVGIGMAPAEEVARKAGLRCLDGIVVDQYARTANPQVYAVGDVARFPDVRTGELTRIEQWQHAQNHGIAAADNLLGAQRAYADTPWFWSHQYDHDIQLAGSWSCADEVVARGERESFRFTQFFLRDRVVIGAFGINPGRDIRGAMALIEAGVPVLPESLADATIDLRALARSAAIGHR